MYSNNTSGYTLPRVEGRRVKLLLSQDQIEHLVLLIDAARHIPVHVTGQFFQRTIEFAQGFVDLHSSELLYALVEETHELYAQQLQVLGLIQFVTAFQNLIRQGAIPKPSIEQAAALSRLLTSLKNSVTYNSNRSYSIAI